MLTADVVQEERRPVEAACEEDAAGDSTQDVAEMHQREAAVASRGGVRSSRVCAVLWETVCDISEPSTSEWTDAGNYCRASGRRCGPGARQSGDETWARLLHDDRRPAVIDSRPQVAARLTTPALACTRPALRSDSACP